MKKILISIILFTSIKARSQKLDIVYKFNKYQYIILVDFTKSIDSNRFWVYSTASRNIILSSKCAHGINSGLEYPDKFSNEINSKKSSLGSFKLAEQYYGIFGKSISLDGISGNLNSNARRRHIIIHSSKKMRTKWSWGCFSIPDDKMKNLLKLNPKNSILISYYK